MILKSFGKPDNTSDAMYQIGINALSVADDYIEGKIMNSEARLRLQEFYEQAKKQYDLECEQIKSITLINTKYENDSMIESAISSLYFSVSNAAPMSEITQNRNMLAARIGK